MRMLFCCRERDDNDEHSTDYTRNGRSACHRSSVGMGMALIEMSAVWKVYDLGEIKVEALRNASLKIDAGEFVALTGQSGSGKSTLMNLLGCLDRPTRGSYRLAGDEVADLTRDDRARIRNQQIGFVFQNFNLLARTSALENAELPMMYAKGVSARERQEPAIAALEHTWL